MIQLDNFYNDGFGWVCKHCALQLGIEEGARHSRFFREGEAESRLANQAIAKWLDAARTTLTCPRCGVTEPAEKF